MTENPGTQLSSSFNPLNADWDDWVKDAYGLNKPGETPFERAVASGFR